MKMKRSLLSMLLAMGVLLGLAVSAAAQNAGELREEFHRTFPLAGNGRISLENISGTVKIVAWDRSEIKVDAVKRAYSRERLEEAQIKFVSDADSMDIHTEYPERNYRIDGNDRRQQHASVDYTLTVPRGANLESIELVNGSLEIEGLTGDVKASLVNGNVKARGLVGEARLSTVNGRLEATFDRLDAAKPISLGSVNGQLILIIPSDANAHLRANTVSGSITNDFGLPVRRGEYVGRDLSGTLGNGGPRIRLSNVSGAINIRHAADNRPLSPATNELSEARGGADDDDEDDDQEREEEARDARREKQRAARDAAREAARAQREERRAARAAQLEGQSDVRAAQAEAAEQARDARLEAERAVREAQLDNAEMVREAQREAQRAVRESQREIQRASREAAREALRANEDIYDNNDLRLVERESKSFPTNGVPTVSLNTFDGRISIRAWDKQEVMVNAIKRAGDEQSLRGIVVKSEQRGSEVNIQTEYDKAAGRRTGGMHYTNASVTLDVFVPRNANIRALSGDGRVELEGVTGGAQLQTGDGRIEVRDGGGQLIVKTGDGHIDVSNYTGDVDAKTGDGRINLDGRFAQLAARTGSGSISLALPSDLDATIETNAESVTNEGMTLEVEPSVGKKMRRYKIGRGGTVFNLHTGEGNVYLHRK